MVSVFRRWLRIAAGVTGPGPREARLRRAVAGKVVLVTGASEGIGAATARRLAKAGATVLLVARTAARLAEVQAQITAAGGTAYAHPADLSRPEEAEALGEELLARYRRVDVVVHCAGRSIRRSVADTADRFHDLRRTIDLNYLGPAQLLLVLLPAMRATGGGHVVNIATAGLALPAQNWSSYLASKAAFDTWLRCAAPELRPQGITVSTIYCGLVRTRMSAPTPHYRRLPAMSAEEAAAMVCRAVAYRRGTTQAWWARLGELPATAFKGTTQRVLSLQPRLAPATDAVRALSGVGVLRPGRLARLARAWRRYGSTLAAAAAAGPPGEVALVDADGPVRGAELMATARRVAAGVHRRLGVNPGDRVAVSCGPHRGFVISTVALGLLGAEAVLLAPDLPARRRAEVLARERVVALIHDGAADGPGTGRRASDQANGDGVRTAAWPSLIDDPARLPRPRRAGRMVVLTSGTTGTPRGVRRRLTLRGLLGPVTTHLRLVPLRPGVPIVVAAPPHHGYGLTYLSAGLTLGLPVVLAAGADPARLVQLTADYRAQLLAALPVQLAQVCDLPDVPDLPDLRAVITGAAPLSPDLCRRLGERFGDRVFNLYGTTEAGWAAIAGPADLRAAPGTVGRPPYGVALRVLDPAGQPLPPGQVGQVHVRGWEPGGAWRATGDLGRLDRAGRLTLLGRVDDLVVSGGENVYPGPVAEVLTAHPDVCEARVEPVPDPVFGQRLRAWVRLHPGATLTEEGLRAWAAQRLSRAERPRDIVWEESNPPPRSAPGRDGPEWG